jgi:hypothetical protein
MVCGRKATVLWGLSLWQSQQVGNMSPHMYACVHKMKSSEVHKGTDLVECVGMDLCQLHLVDISSAVALPGVCRVLTATILTQGVSVEKICQCAGVCCLWWIQVWESVLLEGEFVEPDGKPDKPFHRGAHHLSFPISVFLTTGESTGGLVQSRRGAHEYLLCQDYWTDVCAFWQPLQYLCYDYSLMLSDNYLIV